MVIYATFFSSFSKVIEEGLRQNNNALLRERESLKSNLTTLNKKKNYAEIELNKTKNKIMETKKFLEETKFVLNGKAIELENTKKEIYDLRKELINLKVMYKTVRKDLIHQYKSYYLNFLPSTPMNRTMPKYLQRHKNDVSVKSKYNSRDYVAEAYYGLLEYLKDIASQASTPIQRAATKQIRLTFQQNCSELNIFRNEVDSNYNNLINNEYKHTSISINTIFNNASDALNHYSDANILLYKAIPQAETDCFNDK